MTPQDPLAGLREDDRRLVAEALGPFANTSERRLARMVSNAKAEGRREAIAEVVEMLERRSTEGYWANLLAKGAIISWVKDFSTMPYEPAPASQEVRPCLGCLGFGGRTINDGAAWIPCAICGGKGTSE